MLSSSRKARPVGPWFRERPRAALCVAATLFAVILTLRLLTGTAADAYSMLYIFPIALMAVVFGLRGGLAAGLVAVALTTFWVIVRDVSLTPTGWISRLLPLLLLGVLLGHANDRTRRAEAEQRRLAGAALLHRKAIEINDSLIQGMAVAKWSLEAGRIDSGIRTLDETVVRAQDLVSTLIREAEMDGRSEHLAS
jgi:glucose-6-phosphate-specific signal transduction histidine kinase